MEFVMDFEKPSISKNVAKFLEDNLKTEKEQESLTNVIAGKTVLKIDAITLLITILKALTNNDALEDEEFSATIPTEEGDDGEKEELPKKVTEVLAKKSATPCNDFIAGSNTISNVCLPKYERCF